MVPGNSNSRWRSPAACALLALVGAVLYANSFAAPFVFDGASGLVDANTIRNIWPWKMSLGQNRPVGFLTFGLNYAADGYNVWGFHAVNLAIHVAAACALFGVVRRTLARGRLQSRYGAAAWGLALAVALIWLAHPLQTQSVTYIYQRVESLMGLFYLLTLYAFVRAQDSPRPGFWYALSVVVCALGMGTKEVMVTAPVLVLWYDRVFVATDWRQIARQRGVFYIFLAGTWAILARLLVGSAAEYAKVGVNYVSPLEYALSQPAVILHYLRLCFWPSDLCLDYVWPVPRTADEIVPPAIAILVMLAATLWCMFERPALGFLLGSFFLILSPTSSVSPLLDLAFEHRMYLPLASVTVLVVVAAYTASQKLFGEPGPEPSQRAGLGRFVRAAAVVAVVCLLGGLTIARNNNYRSNLEIWQDTVEKRPHNLRARTNLAKALFDAGDVQRGLDELNRVIEIGSDDAWDELPENRGKKPGSRDDLLRALVAAKCQNPHMSWAYVARARVYLHENRPEQAVEECNMAIELGHDNAEAYAERGKARQSLNQLPQALQDYSRSIELDPKVADVYFKRGTLQLLSNHFKESIADFTKAIELNPRYADAYTNRAICWFQKKELDRAWADVRASEKLGGHPAPAFLQALEGASQAHVESNR